MYRLISNTLSVVYRMTSALLEYTQDETERKEILILLIAITNCEVKFKNREALKRALLL